MPIRDILAQVSSATKLDLPRVRVSPRGDRGQGRYDLYAAKMQLEAAKENRLRTKMFADLARQEAKAKFDKEKFHVQQWTEAVHAARDSGDMALQKNLLSKGRFYLDNLSDESYELMQSYIQAGPFDPMKEKMERFDEHNPAPKISADQNEAPLAYAQQLFQYKDWEAYRTTVATGKTPPKSKIIGLDGENFAVRSKDGEVSIANEEDLELKEFAKSFKTTPGQVMADGGAYGTERTVVANGYKTEYRPFVSFPEKEVFNPETGERQLVYQRSLVNTDRTMTTEKRQELSRKEKTHENFLANWGLEKPKSDLVRQVKRLHESGLGFDEISETVLKPITGMNYRKISFGEKPGAVMGFLQGLSNWTSGKPYDYAEYAEDNVLVAFPGELTTFGTLKGKPWQHYYDPDTDSVWSDSGTSLGSLSEVLARAKSGGIEINKELLRNLGIDENDL